MPVDLRSDTVTRPSSAMRQAMAAAEVGDDCYGEDPTINALQERMAGRLGKEAGLFLPSSTMGNQVALRVLTKPGTVVVAGRSQHIVAWENAAAPLNAHIQFEQADDGAGWWDPMVLTAAAEAGAYHRPAVSMAAVEDTHMASGGAAWPIERLEELRQAAAATGVAVHMDGARLFHAEVATGVSAARRAAAATTVTVCLSKGLGAPTGSVLCGPADLIEKARVERGRLGGGMRQAGILAAAGLYALDHHVERLADDHRRARELAMACARRWPGSVELDLVTTNIVLVGCDAKAVAEQLSRAGVLVGPLAPGVLRFVTHLDVDDDGLAAAVAAIENLE